MGLDHEREDQQCHSDGFSCTFGNVEAEQQKDNEWQRNDIRIRRLSLGNPGDVKPVGEGVSELRVKFGPGYRVYFVQRGNEYIVLLAGGGKSSQDSDIREAKVLARKL